MRRTTTIKAIIVGGMALLAVGLFGAPTAIVAQQKTVWDGVYTAQQATRGEALYQAQCSACHGEQLRGNDAPGLTGPEFFSNWDGRTVKDLFDKIKTSMPQGSEGSLTGNQTADVIAFVLSRAGFPAGGSELPESSNTLADVKLVATKP
jgi:cytochrome c